jgi:hypothetical protein
VNQTVTGDNYSTIRCGSPKKHLLLELDCVRKGGDKPEMLLFRNTTEETSIVAGGSADLSFGKVESEYTKGQDEDQ